MLHIRAFENRGSWKELEEPLMTFPTFMSFLGCEEQLQTSEAPTTFYFSDKKTNASWNCFRSQMKGYFFRCGFPGDGIPEIGTNLLPFAFP